MCFRATNFSFKSYISLEGDHEGEYKSYKSSCAQASATVSPHFTSTSLILTATLMLARFRSYPHKFHASARRRAALSTEPVALMDAKSSDIRASVRAPRIAYRI